MDINQHSTFSRIVRALVLSEGAAYDEMVGTILQRLNCDVVRGMSAQAALEQIRRVEPDIIVLLDPVAGGTSLGVIDLLKSTGGLSATVPLVAVLSVPASESEKLKLQERGVWNIAVHPLDGAAFEARLRNYLVARHAHVTVRDAALIDEVTGLYTRRGLDARAVELAAQCARQGTLLSCVAFTLSAADSVTRSVELETPRLAALGDELRRIGRTSDTIGRSDRHDFVVLAPGANGADARQLANRITRSVTSLLGSQGIACDAPWVGRVLQPSRNADGLGEELLSDTLLALQEVTSEHEIPALLT